MKSRFAGFLDKGGLREVRLLGHLFAYGGARGLPSLVRYFFLKLLRIPVAVPLRLGPHRWSATTMRPGGLRFFVEVIVRRSYAAVEDDLRRLPAPLVVDAGANCGAFALWALSVNPSARVISFEPGSSFERLVANCALRGAGEAWRVERCALAAASGRGFFADDPHSSMGKLRESGTTEVEIRALDDCALPADLLKIDVEGHEAEMLKGAAKTLANARVVVLEYHREDLRLQCRDLLAAQGYALEEVGGAALLIGRKAQAS